ncbi:MAG: Nif3-like dinuclear metal center hexameric protein [Campylobacterales bacterium]|nr:Nif3-like dinuclear metal center hexameric protein [Campylobacterales bacterium]
MKISQLYDFLNQVSPFELQEPWDNSGLIIGSFDDEFENVYISLDLDLQLVEQLESNSVIITHHPLIFKGLKRINNDTYSTKILKQLIKKDIALISMHTNIDKTHLNDYVATKVLDLPFEKTNDFLFSAQVQMGFDQVVEYLKAKLQIKKLKVTRANDRVNCISLCTGSGMGMLDMVKCDMFLTSDIKYHEAMEAMARGISLIDMGHYESEQYFTELIYDIVEKYLKKNQIKAIMMDSQNPFEYI